MMSKEVAMEKVLAFNPSEEEICVALFPKMLHCDICKQDKDFKFIWVLPEYGIECCAICMVKIQQLERLLQDAE